MLQIGELIDGKYKILNTIGQGGMSVVYLAMNEKANKQWAIKEVRKDGIQDFEIVRQGLVTEIEMLKRFSHPNLPTIVDVIEDENRLLIVMDYIQGNPLSKALEEYGAQPQENVIIWAKQLCDVLSYLHTRTPPIIYRDMKPQNVMLKPDGNISLIDFGTAREFKEKNLADTTCLGTRGYAAPEQFGGMGQTDERTDIYCLGATIYHLVTGQNPCEPPYEILPIRQINPALSSGLEKILVKCTKQNPDERYPSCAELMYALEHYEEIDVIYRRAQKKKLFRFAAAAVLSLVFAATSAFGHYEAQAKKDENYDNKLIEASNGKLPQSDRENLYIEAIIINSSKYRAYKELLDLFKVSKETHGRISRDESARVGQLKLPLDIKDSSGITRTIDPPLGELKKKSPAEYAEFCYNLGLAYWYDYEVRDARYTVATEWFKNAIEISPESFPRAQIYIEIGEYYSGISEYKGDAGTGVRTEAMYEAYKNLWESLIELESKATALDKKNRDEKFLAWNEIVKITRDDAKYFLEITDSVEMLKLLDSISAHSAAEQKKDVSGEMKKNIDQMIVDIESVKVKIESGS